MARGGRRRLNRQVTPIGGRYLSQKNHSLLAAHFKRLRRPFAPLRSGNLVRKKSDRLHGVPRSEPRQMDHMERKAAQRRAEARRLGATDSRRRPQQASLFR